jgi:eukaryotic-like serine/threonine-protein kinase
MPDTVIAGRYRLDDVLGRTAMSEVWRAEDLELGRHVAIKLLAPEADTARFEREARAVASLAHPNITHLYDYGHSDGRPYIVLEYLSGGTLENRLRDGKPLPDDEVFDIAAGVAAGLAHAHARGVVHRDLKPANVLFDEEGRPKLADFGLARMAAGDGTLTEAGTLLGTAAYISPEQAFGQPATAASDVYSFGVILYRLLTGRLPFESSDPMELVTLHRDAPPPPIAQFRADAPALLESTAAACLAKDPADRPPDGAALLAELDLPPSGTSLGTSTAVLAGEVTQVLPVPPPEPQRRRRAPLIAAGLLVLALAGSALAYAMTRSSTPSGPNTISSTVAASTTKPTTSAATTTTAPSTSTQATTTQQTATAPTTAPQTTLTFTPAPTTTPPQTTAPPPITTAPPPTTTAPPPTTEPATTAAP